MSGPLDEVVGQTKVPPRNKTTMNKQNKNKKEEKQNKQTNSVEDCVHLEKPLIINMCSIPSQNFP